MNVKKFWVIGYRTVTDCEKVYYTVDAESEAEAKRLVEAGEVEEDESKCVECISAGPVEVKSVEVVA